MSAQERADLEPEEAPHLHLVPNPDDEWLEGLMAWAEEQEGPPPAEFLRDLAAVGRAPAADAEEEAELEPAARWRIDGDRTAEWAMAKVRRATEELAAIDAQAAEWRADLEEQLERIGGWVEHRRKRHVATREFLGAHLEGYALELRAADPKAKTLVLPSGAVRTEERKPTVEVADEAAVAAWADDHLEPGKLLAVAPPAPRKVYVGPLRKAVAVVQVIDHAKLVLTSGEVLEWRLDLEGAGAVCPGVGDGWPCPEEAEALVGQVHVLESHLEVHDAAGNPVPGCEVRPGGTSAKVVPA